VHDDFVRVEAHDCPMSSCAAAAGSPCRTGKGKGWRPSPATVLRMLRDHAEQSPAKTRT
jgi:hypothetical protein